MPLSEARIQANKQNATKSTGPKTVEGKEKSRRNSLKHGLTGEGVVLLVAAEAEVQRRTSAYSGELMAIGEVGQAVARRAALSSVRMDRAIDQQKAAMTLHIRQVEDEFEAPEDASDEEAAQLRTEAIRAAMFDPSREATLARQYENAAERSFYRAIKQLRQMEIQAEALLKQDDEARVNAMVGSILESQRSARKMDDEFDALYPEFQELRNPKDRLPENSSRIAQTTRHVDVPITIGRSR